MNEQQVTELHQRLDDHAERFKEYDKNFELLLNAQQGNTEAITQLTASVSSLVEDTRAVVQLHKDFQGAARVGKGLQGFMTWCLKWGAIGAGVVAGINWLLEHFRT